MNLIYSFHPTSDLSPEPRRCHHLALGRQGFRGFPEFDNVAIDYLLINQSLGSFILSPGYDYTVNPIWCHINHKGSCLLQTSTGR